MAMLFCESSPLNFMPGWPRPVRKWPPEDDLDPATGLGGIAVINLVRSDFVPDFRRNCPTR